MLKKVLSLVLCMALLLCGTITVAASAENTMPTVVSAYSTENSLNLFFENSDMGDFKAGKDKIGGEKAVNIVDARVAVSYIVLHDTSISMKNQGDMLKGFVGTLLKNELWESRVVLIPYNTKIYTDNIIDTFGLDRETAIAAVNAGIDKLEYKNADNLASSCLVDTLEYLHTNFPAKQGELANLILVTDGTSESSSNEKARTAIDSSPEFLFHTLMASQASNNGKTFGGKGCNLVTNYSKTGSEAAEEIINTIAEIECVSLNWNGNSDFARTDIDLYLQFNNEGKSMYKSFQVEDVAVLLDNPEAEGMYLAGGEYASYVPAVPELPDEASSGEGEEPAAKGEEPAAEGEEPAAEGEEPAAEGEEPAAEGEEPAAEGEEPAAEGEEPAAEGEEPAAEGEEAAAEGEEPAAEDEELASEDKEALPIWLLAAAGAAVLLIVILLICLLSSKKKKASASDYEVFMKLEVLSGNIKSKKREFGLSDEILIGKSHKCDVVFAESEVSDVNTRVFLKDGTIYIEDLNSSRGTSLEGMRIYSQNRLRSGNEIAIGNVRFKFKF